VPEPILSLSAASNYEGGAPRAHFTVRLARPHPMWWWIGVEREYEASSTYAVCTQYVRSMHPVSTLYFRFGGACIAESCSVLQVVRATYLPTTHALTHARTHARPEQELRFSVGSAEERALLLETLDALRKRAAQPRTPIAWGAWETGSACSEPVE